MRAECILKSLYRSMNITNRNEEDQLIGMRVKALRQQRGISLAELATRVEGDASALSLAEAGLSHFSGATVQRIACAMGVDVSELLSGAPGGKFDEIKSIRAEICMTTTSLNSIEKLNRLLALARQMKDAE